MNCRNLLYCLCLSFLFSWTLKGQTINGEPFYCTDEDRAIFDRYLTAMQSKTSLPTEALLIETGKFFLGTPYVASTLEKEPEGLVINLRELDCTTFVENVIALTRTVQGANPSFESYCHNLQNLRYREGHINDYTDRLHYTSDWIYVNQQKGFVKDVSRQIGGSPLPLNLFFVSTHPDSYKQLKGKPDLTQKMAAIEKNVNSRSYYYIPEARINSLGKNMQNGDMVGFVTKIEGLDVTHVGLICWEGEKLTFIHASSAAKKVIINEDPLQTYVEKGKNTIGIFVVRSQTK